MIQWHFDIYSSTTPCQIDIKMKGCVPISGKDISSEKKRTDSGVFM